MTAMRTLDTLPREIQHATVRHLEWNDRWRCCGVCKAWRSMILSWQDMWSSLSEAHWDRISLRPEYYRPYLSESSVHHAYLIGGNESSLPARIDFLASLQCTALKEVEVIASELPEPSLLKLVTLYGNTLSRISVTLSAYAEPGTQPVIHGGPAIVLRHCHSLSWLTYFGPLSDEWTQCLVEVRHTHLAYLAMEIPNCYGDLDTETVLKAAPKLQHLALSLANVSNDARLPAKLRQHCPELMSVFLTNDMWHYLEEHAMHRERQSAEPSQGIKDLTLLDPLSAYPVVSDIVMHFAQDHHASLRSLELAGRYLLADPVMQQLSTYVFPSLTRITAGSEARVSGTKIPLFLAHAVPSLEYLALVGEVEPDDELLSSLCGNARHLQEFQFGSHTVAQDTLIRFLETMTHPDWSLRKINFLSPTPALTPAALHRMSASHRCALQELKVNVDERYGGLTVHTFDSFLDESLRAGKTFAKLELSFYDMMDPAFFADTKEAKQFLRKLDAAAKEWTLLVVPAFEIMHVEAVRMISVTHVQYRTQKIEHVV